MPTTCTFTPRLLHILQVARVEVPSSLAGARALPNCSQDGGAQAMRALGTYDLRLRSWKCYAACAIILAVLSFKKKKLFRPFCRLRIVVALVEFPGRQRLISFPFIQSDASLFAPCLQTNALLLISTHQHQVWWALEAMFTRIHHSPHPAII